MKLCVVAVDVGEILDVFELERKILQVKIPEDSLKCGRPGRHVCHHSLHNTYPWFDEGGNPQDWLK